VAPDAPPWAAGTPVARAPARVDLRSRSSFRPGESTTTTSWMARCASSRRCRRRSISARAASWCWPWGSSADSVPPLLRVRRRIRRLHRRQAMRCRRSFSTISRRISSA
jgi:hypothetical protein